MRRNAATRTATETHELLPEGLPLETLSIETGRVSIRVSSGTSIEGGDRGGLYRFQSLDGRFTADLPADSDGLVLDYPGLFKRALP